MKQAVTREELELCSLMWTVFRTPEGAKALEALKERFDAGVPFSADNERLSNVLVGQHSVIRWIEEKIRGARRYREAEPGELETYTEEEDF